MDRMDSHLDEERVALLELHLVLMTGDLMELQMVLTKVSQMEFPTGQGSRMESNLDLPWD